MHSNDIRNLLNTLKSLENETCKPVMEDMVGEDLRGIINAVKNKISGKVSQQVADQQGADTPDEEQSIEDKIDAKMQQRATSIYNTFLHDFHSAGLRPTVKNVIQWLRGHPSISDDAVLAHAFKSIGIDASSVINTKTADDTEIDWDDLLGGSDEDPAEKKKPSEGEPSKPESDEQEKVQEPHANDDTLIPIGDLKDGQHFIYSWTQQDGTHRTSKGVRTGTNELGQVTTKWESGSNGSLLPDNKVKPLDSDEQAEQEHDEQGTDDVNQTSENNKERVKRIHELLVAAGKDFSGDDNRFKSILGTVIARDPSQSDMDVVKQAAAKFGKKKIKTVDEPEPQDEPVPVKPEQEQKKEDKQEGKVPDNSIKIFDKNGSRILPGQVVKVKLRRGTSKFETFGKVKTLLRGDNGDCIARVEFTGEDIGSAEDLIYDIHAWELLKDPERMTLWDADEDEVQAESYEAKFSRMLLETKFHFGTVLSEEEMTLVEAMINIALAEDAEVANDELDKAELLGLFEILLYMAVAKKKGFDITEVTPKFKNEDHMKAYLKRMYSRMLSTMKQYTSLKNDEKQTTFKEIYSKVVHKLSGDLQKMVQQVAVKMVKEKKNYPLAIAFFTVLFTIMNEQKNKNVLAQYIKRLYDLVADIKTPANPSEKDGWKKVGGAYIKPNEPDHKGRVEPKL